MLKEENRLTKKRDFDRNFKMSRPVYVGNLSIRASRQQNDGPNKIGFIISNKVDKRSTRRNALRRQLRQIFQSLLPEIKNGYNIVVMVKNNFDFPYKQEEIKKQVESGLKKSGIYKTN